MEDPRLAWVPDDSMEELREALPPPETFTLDSRINQNTWFLFSKLL